MSRTVLLGRGAFQRWVVVAMMAVLAAVVVMMGGGAPKAGAHGEVDQENPATNYPACVSINLEFGSWWAQEFVPTKSPMVALDLAFSDDGPDNPEMTLEIRAGTWTGPIAGIVTMNVNVGGVNGHEGPMVHIDLPTPVTVTPGDTYVLIPYTHDDRLDWCQSTDTYPHGLAINNGVPRSIRDMGFRTYSPRDPVLEALDEVQAGIDALEGKSDTLLVGQGDISAAIANLQAAIDGIESSDDTAALAALETKADSLLAGHGYIVSALANLQSAIDAIETGDDSEALAALETKADGLLSGQSDISAAIAAIESSDDTAALAALETKADVLGSEVADIKGALAALQGQVDALDTSGLASQESVDALEAKLDMLIQMIEDLPMNNGNQGGNGKGKP